MKIGSVLLKNNTVLAPLAGISNLPFRLMVKAYGCALVCSEMISANGMVRATAKTLRILDSAPQEKPLSVQLFGADPAVMAEAALMVESRGADIVDINCGCAVRKIIKSGSGVALMREPQRAEQVITAVRKAVKIPLTIKMRSGWEPGGRQALELARIAQGCGADAVTVHPRSATQRFGGRSDWGLIGAVKREISLPVIGNGDITTGEDALQMLQLTGCDGVMIGRGAIGNPFIFSEVIACLQGQAPPQTDLALRRRTMRHYLEESVTYIGETHACYMMRSRLGWFVKGLPHNSRFRESIKRVTSRAEAESLIDAYFEFLEKNSCEVVEAAAAGQP
ncbi:MAG: tRNA dihydrouridine synthase DusB [Thermodesulfobacteriota bacterium]